MRKIILLALLAAALIYGSHEFVAGGRYEKLALENRDSSWSAPALYYLGNLYLILQNPARAEELYLTVAEHFPETKYYEPSVYRCYYISSKHGSRADTLERGSEYLSEFPDGAWSELVSRRIEILRSH